MRRRRREVGETGPGEAKTTGETKRLKKRSSSGIGGSEGTDVSYVLDHHNG